MAAPQLKALYKRELLVAPKLAFAMLGCTELHTVIAERLRDKIKLTSSVPAITDFPKLFGTTLSCMRAPIVACTPSPWPFCSQRSSQIMRPQNPRCLGADAAYDSHSCRISQMLLDSLLLLYRFTNSVG